MKTIALIGSTGSIGRQVCSVVRRHPEKFKIKSIVANASSELFLEQVREFMPEYAALANEEAGRAIVKDIPQGVKFDYGEKAAEEDEPAQKDALPALTSESLSVDYPDWAPSLFTLIKNTENEHKAN